jgi:hypothetical protein
MCDHITLAQQSLHPPLPDAQLPPHALCHSCTPRLRQGPPFFEAPLISRVRPYESVRPLGRARIAYVFMVHLRNNEPGTHSTNKPPPTAAVLHFGSTSQLNNGTGGLQIEIISTDEWLLTKGYP